MSRFARASPIGISGKIGLPLTILTKLSAVSRTQDRSAPRQDAADAFGRQFSRMRFAEDALKAVLDADAVHPEFADRRPDDRPDRRI